MINKMFNILPHRYQLAAVMPIFRIDESKMLGQFSGLAQLHMIEAVELYVTDVIRSG